MRLLKNLPYFFAATLAAIVILIPPGAAAKSTQSRGGDKKVSPVAVRLRGSSEALPGDDVSELSGETIDLPEPVGLSEMVSPELSSGGQSLNGLARPAVNGAGRISGAEAAQYSSFRQELNPAGVAGLSDAVADGKTRFDLAAKGSAKDISKDPVRVVYAEDGRVLGLGRYLRERDARREKSSLEALPGLKTIGRAAAAGLFTLIAAGAAMASEPVALVAAPTLATQFLAFSLPVAGLAIPAAVLTQLFQAIFLRKYPTKTDYGWMNYSSVLYLDQEKARIAYSEFYHAARKRWVARLFIPKGLTDPSADGFDKIAFSKIVEDFNALDRPLSDLENVRLAVVGLVTALVPVLLAGPVLHLNAFAGLTALKDAAFLTQSFGFFPLNGELLTGLVAALPALGAVWAFSRTFGSRPGREPERPAAAAPKTAEPPAKTSTPGS